MIKLSKIDGKDCIKISVSCFPPFSRPPSPSLTRSHPNLNLFISQDEITKNTGNAETVREAKVLLNIGGGEVKEV